MNEDLIDDVVEVDVDDVDAGEGADNKADGGSEDVTGNDHDGSEDASGKGKDGGEDVSGNADSAGEDAPEGASEEAKADGEEKPTKVPLSELLEERRRRQAIEQQAMELQARIAAQEQLKEEMRQLREQLKGGNEDDGEKIPDFDEDPIEHLKAKTEKQEQVIQQQLEAQRQAQEQQQAMAQQQEAIRQVVTEINRREAEFVKEAPDYYDALEHVRGIQRQNLSGLGLSPDQVEAEVARAELETGIAALQNGVDPASYVYNIAKRMGYTHAKQGDGTDTDSGIDTKAKMDALEKGAKAQSTDGGVSLKDLADIDDDDEFEAAMKDVFGG